MNVLVACEESQEVCKAFREKGHTAFSCDLQECSGGHPEWHIQGDALNILNGYCSFKTMDGIIHDIPKNWDLIIAHPPCTYLTTAATQCHSTKVYTLDQIADRTFKRIEAMQFFMNFVNADCERIAIENPVCVMNTCYRKPDQILEPYYFAVNENDTKNYVTKKTCLWLKGLPRLAFDKARLENPMNKADTWGNGKRKNWTESHHGGKARSKTFPGIAKAMADQWG